LSKLEGERWLEFSGEDIQMAELALTEGIFRQTCFHAQQAAEKALKGLLVSRTGAHQKGHSLEAMLLLPGIENVERQAWRARCRNLDRFYIPTRYADALPGLLPSGEPTPADAEEALRDAKTIVAEIRGKIGGRR